MEATKAKQKKQVLVVLDENSVVDKALEKQIKTFRLLSKRLGLTYKQALLQILESGNKQLEDALKEAVMNI